MCAPLPLCAAKVNGAYSAGFSFVRDVGNVAEMAAALGFSADAAKYSALYVKLKAGEPAVTRPFLCRKSRENLLLTVRCWCDFL